MIVGMLVIGLESSLSISLLASSVQVVPLQTRVFKGYYNYGKSNHYSRKYCLCGIVKKLIWIDQSLRGMVYFLEMVA